MKNNYLTFKIFTAALISFLSLNISFAESSENSLYSSDSIVVNTGQTVIVNSDLTVSTIRIYSGGTLIINSDITVTIVEDLSGFNELELYSGGTITGAGLLKTNCEDEHDIILAIWGNSSFDVDFESESGRAVFKNAFNENYISTRKKITIDSGASMIYYGTGGNSRLTIWDNIINNGELWSSNGLITFKGQSIMNNDTIHADIEIDTTCIIYGTGAWVSVYLFINQNRTLSLGNNISTSVRNFILQANAKLNLNSYTITLIHYIQYSYSEMLMYESSMISSGTVKTKGNTVKISIDTTAKLYASLLVDSGNAQIGTLFGPRTILDSSVIINNNTSFNSDFEVIFKNNVINNGYLDLNFCKFRGNNIVNNGSACSGLINFESNCNLSGNGLWTCASYTYIKPDKTVTLQGDVRIRITSFEIQTDATLNTNGHSFILDHSDGSSSGNLSVDSAATVTGAGEVIAKGHPEIFHVNIFNQYNSNFNAALRVSSGLLQINDPSSKGKSVFNNLITVDSGATLATQILDDTIIANHSIVNNGTLSGIYKLYGNSFVNNGNVRSAYFFFSSATTEVLAQNFQGTGSFNEPSYCIINNGTTVNLNSNHQLFNLKINSGGTFNITNRTLKISGLGTQSVINNGNFVTTTSTIEFNSQNNFQYLPVININYNNVRINNPMGLILTGNVTLPALLTLSNGDIDLNGFKITLTPSATLIETSGNTVKGNNSNGYITATRDLNAPSNLNVAGIGAVLTTTANLGSTEIRRGHISSIILGRESVFRYFNIIPTNNTGLNAMLGFKYDHSELGTLPESGLGLFKSTNNGTNFRFAGGSVDTTNNQITLSGINDFSRWTAGLISVPANIKLVPEAFLDINTLVLNSRDTITVYLASSSPPFNFIDSAKAVIDSVTYTGSFLFANANSGTYYIVIKHRNSIETWSKTGGELYSVGNVLNFNFTSSQSQAFGNNLISKASVWCIFSGDVNGNGTIDGTDTQLIDNDAYNYTSGYVSTDITGDGIVDGSDVAIADNNAFNFVTKITP